MAFNDLNVRTTNEPVDWPVSGTEVQSAPSSSGNKLRLLCGSSSCEFLIDCYKLTVKEDPSTMDTRENSASISGASSRAKALLSTEGKELKPLVEESTIRFKKVLNTEANVKPENVEAARSADKDGGNNAEEDSTPLVVVKKE